MTQTSRLNIFLDSLTNQDFETIKHLYDTIRYSRTNALFSYSEDPGVKEIMERSSGNMLFITSEGERKQCVETLDNLFGGEQKSIEACSQTDKHLDNQ
ncbi:hypothetical protein QNI19_09340 [Cytophagaceae bacterium DM2B3-1]|uniref:Uncharacterized protein n=1 Tax=Xanthocytophaga flava TaxID=3048013 RepID=A0ABT7CJA2_9BACT|nr:hypothetical protein [Xanthocytophaga flavus]MDJ1470733.1 hypothetical protein [Xanthocytophaga flavus]MDJ1493132.1 hypothetical protein [Xanthocytophaga flavus]